MNLQDCHQPECTVNSEVMATACTSASQTADLATGMNLLGSYGAVTPFAPVLG